MGLSDKGIIVATYYVFSDSTGRETEVYVISDGSLFINQVLRSNQTRYNYKEFVKDLVTSMAPNPRSTIVFIDASKYELKPLTELKYSPETVVKDPKKLLALIGLLLHPYTWFPWFANLARSLESKALKLLASDEGLLALITIVASLLASGLLSRLIGVKGEVISRDEALTGTSEVDIVIDTELRRSIASGRRVKLGKRDFISLYKLVDEALRKTIGSGLDDKDVARKIANIANLDEHRVVKYVERMNKLKIKVERGALLPIVLSWNATLHKLIEESNRMLEKLGVSLIESRGVEYVIRRK